MKNTLTRIAPAWHQEAAQELNADFAAIEELQLSARKRRAYLGLKFIYVKERGKADGSIPHSQFGGWLLSHCPGIPPSTIGGYITYANNLLKVLGWQNSEIRNFETPLHKLIASPHSAKNDQDREHQQLLLDLVECRGKFREISEFKQVEEGEDGMFHVKHGRLAGEGGRRPDADLDEKARMLQWIGKAADRLDKVGSSVILLERNQREVLLAKLERMCRVIRESLRTAKPDVTIIEKLWNEK